MNDTNALADEIHTATLHDSMAFSHNVSKGAHRSCTANETRGSVALALGLRSKKLGLNVLRTHPEFVV